MKKFLFIVLTFITCLMFSSCTSNYRARNFGGNTTVDLPAGQKLIMATWKESEIWYLMETAEEGYEPKVKVFRESSSYGIIEGSVTFIEH